ncbi:sodium-dependent transporter [Pseudidiomarina gelatinasegens]|uniref:Transporter n=1 Tax=Pseudidiomarina gelatinasegens TaxID=2487740 RepID=A0A443Z5U9_9GAMM|nr:sodium-dependent transporter [Pseudidiomarina gelatinasegens]RWU12161.1 sodium-dependent transporter [Pseudidiomarina gelatinasegens]
MHESPSIASRWSSRLLFILASTAAAVGLGNIWKFPYITGENGGGAFVLVYLLCIAGIGIPIMIAEIIIGRRGRHSPGYAARQVARESGRSKAWQITGWVGMATGFLVLSFYAVIAGWALAYVYEAASGTFAGASVAEIDQVFGDLVSSSARLTLWHGLIIAGVVLVVGNGIKDGLERAVSWLLPAMVILLIGLAGYAAYIGDFAAAVDFMFAPDFSELTINGVMLALGHAFFSLGLASGVVIMYGAYLSKSTSVVQTSLWVALADTLVALLAGLAIFPIVFGSQLTPEAGPGLIFQTLPVAFSQMPAGNALGTIFFIMLVIAAFTSAIAMIESAVAFMEERFKLNRWPATMAAGFTLWLLGQVTIYSFSGASWTQIDWQVPGKQLTSLFDVIDYATSNVLLPLGGLLLAVFAGWVMKSAYSSDELNTSPKVFRLWQFIVRWLAPIAIVLIFLQLIGIIQF